MMRAHAQLSSAVAGLALLLAQTGCAASATPPLAPGGAIATLALGSYTCEMPGDAGGAVGKPVPDYAFRVVNSSSYKAGGIRGSYLFVGDRVTMTGGKLKGLKLHRISAGFLREVKPDGTDGDLRCVRASRK
ncbi:hypothetical protein [Novosphingobium sp. AP12]|uniref:hypothetical protein n=1 Tax=Novosphingobium sp. AP12 TaxID=1144305 RepID=UPI000271EBE7|nr:hypothetical protein [Novosphingobium sp. AP12]EJL35304.1 hypothetical protein PMI02_00136 [Novosphingobium sp. AP12]